MLVVVPQEEEQLTITTTVATTKSCSSGDGDNDNKDPAQVSPVETVLASHRLPFKKRLKELMLMQQQQKSTDTTNTTLSSSLPMPSPSFPLPDIVDFFNEDDSMTAELAALKPPELVRHAAKYHARTQKQKLLLAESCSRKREFSQLYEPLPLADTSMSSLSLFGCGGSGGGTNSNSNQHRNLLSNASGITSTRSSVSSSFPALYPSFEQVEDCCSNPTKKNRHHGLDMQPYSQQRSEQAYHNSLPDLKFFSATNDDTLSSTNHRSIVGVSPQPNDQRRSLLSLKTPPPAMIEDHSPSESGREVPFVLERADRGIASGFADACNGQARLMAIKKVSATYNKTGRSSSSPRPRLGNSTTKEVGLSWKPLTTNGIQFGRRNKDMEGKIRLHQYLLSVNKNTPSLEDLMKFGIISPVPKDASVKEAPPTNMIVPSDNAARRRTPKTNLKSPPRSSLPSPEPADINGSTAPQEPDCFHYSDSAILSSYSYQDDPLGYRPHRVSGSGPYNHSSGASRQSLTTSVPIFGTPEKASKPGNQSEAIRGRVLPFSPIVTPGTCRPTTAARRVSLPETPLNDHIVDGVKPLPNGGWV